MSLGILCQARGQEASRASRYSARAPSLWMARSMTNKMKTLPGLGDSRRYGSLSLLNLMIGAARFQGQDFDRVILASVLGAARSGAPPAVERVWLCQLLLLDGVGRRIENSRLWVIFKCKIYSCIRGISIVYQEWHSSVRAAPKIHSWARLSRGKKLLLLDL